MRRLLLLPVLVLATASPAVAGLPFFSSGSVVGEGQPLKAYTTLTPQVHLFGDAVTARIAVIADTKFVDPARLRITTSFKPYLAVGDPVVLRLHSGRFAQVTWTWTLRCLTSRCVPKVRYRVFRFAPIHITYLASSGATKYTVVARWPKVEALSQISPGVAAFLLQHRRDVARRSIAEQLAELLLVVGNTMLFDEPNEIGWSIPGECRLGEMWIGRKKVFRAGVEVGEIAAATAGDQDLLADSIRAFKQQDPPAPLARFHGTHQAGSARSENDDVVSLIHLITSLTGSARVGTLALARTR